MNLFGVIGKTQPISTFVVLYRCIQHINHFSVMVKKSLLYVMQTYNMFVCIHLLLAYNSTPRSGTNKIKYWFKSQKMARNASNSTCIQREDAINNSLLLPKRILWKVYEI